MSLQYKSFKQYSLNVIKVKLVNDKKIDCLLKTPNPNITDAKTYIEKFSKIIFDGINLNLSKYNFFLFILLD
ncbi:hypothetical protein BTO04_14900 [Polaribacter sp. SA4-10]|nr:hypothetical protein BTO04_14900 [Polaribacter sp. SA4-10]